MQAVLIFFLILSRLVFSQNEEKPFVIVISSYNNSDWYQYNLDSVFNQKYENYRVIYIADAPTDGTQQLVEEYVKGSNQGCRFTLIKNKERSGPLACMCQAVFSCDPNEIVVDLDGNDWLAHEEVLSKLNNIYANSDVWMTYGQFTTYPGFTKGFASQVPKEIIEQNNFRAYGGAVTHLKTFYASLFQKIKKDDFLYEGRFIQKAGDLAYSIPISEMAGSHTRFISEVLYMYNNSSPINENKSSDELESKMDRFIRGKEKYAPLSQLSDPPNAVYSQIGDILYPTLQELRFIQEFLSNGKRENIERLRDMESVVRNIKIIGNPPHELPRSGVIHVNCDPDDKENCILLYSTFNRNYPNGLKRLLKLIVESDFKGHVLYRLGGWPNTEGGSLVLSHVPYAFKASFFKEAERLGYKRALWLDTAVIPLVSLNDILKTIQDKGVFVMGNSHMLGPYMNPQAAAFFGLTFQQTFQIPSCSAGLFGVDFTNEKGKKIIDWWYRAAHDKEAFFSARSDQSALSIILYQFNISDFVNLDRLPHSPYDVKPDSLFRLDREFVQN